jgi:predicted HicB family RNase H-like nuclease
MQGKHLNESYTLRIPEDLKNWAKRKAEKDGRSLNSFVTRQLEKARKEDEQNVQPA